MPSSFPLIYRWGTGPDCQSLKRRCLTVDHEPVVTAPPWRDTGPTDKPFDFCKAMTALIGAISSGCQELGHIDAAHLLIGVSLARASTRYGLQARVTPLRFPDGSVHVRRGSRTFQVQRHLLNGVEMLYHVTFCLPRFMDQSFDEKMVTIFHELYHIHPRFNGDLRRHPGRCHAHTESQSMYDAHMAALARLWLSTRPDPALTAFLRLDFAQLAYRHSGIMGVLLPRPRLGPLTVAS
jgi:predicted metallopeptidase